MENQILRKLRDKMRILSTHSLLCQQFAASEGKLRLSFCPTPVLCADTTEHSVSGSGRDCAHAGVNNRKTGSSRNVGDA